jgi:glycosyltransferase involved in cell wall biosynthesis
MPGKTKLVSVIIPAFNAAPFIQETILSIYGQTYTNWEVIIVDDGSEDSTVSICKTFSDERIQVVRQINSGVATARNNGLHYSKGDYIVFFDADDLMSPGFLSLRVQAMEDEPGIGYVGGLVETFPIAAKKRKAAASDPVNEILFFDPAFVTVPSNYLFKKEVLIKNNIIFNKKLSSTADRFFILEVSKFAKGKYIDSEKGKLLYRFTSGSMSNKVTPGLIIDNEKFYYELKRKNLLPAGKASRFKSIYFLSLAKGFGIVKHWKSVFKYLAMSFINHPFLFAENFGKSIFKFSSFKTSPKGI